MAAQSSTELAAHARADAADASLAQPASDSTSDPAHTILHTSALSSEADVEQQAAVGSSAQNISDTMESEQQQQHLAAWPGSSQQARGGQAQQQWPSASQGQQPSWQHHDLPAPGNARQRQADPEEQAAASSSASSALASMADLTQLAQQPSGGSSTREAGIPDEPVPDSSDLEEQEAQHVVDRAHPAAAEAALQPELAAPAVPAMPAGQEPMAFEDLIGLRGPVRLLFENAATMILSGAMFILGALWLPFTWGRLIIKAIAMLQAAWRLTVLPTAAVQLLLKTDQVSCLPELRQVQHIIFKLLCLSLL